jgi:hypothetical protein
MVIKELLNGMLVQSLYRSLTLGYPVSEMGNAGYIALGRISSIAALLQMRDKGIQMGRKHAIG